MILGKIVALFILVILIIYNSINVHFLPFVLLLVYCISIITSFILMLGKSRKIKLYFKKDRYIYDIGSNAALEIVSRNVSSMPLTNTVVNLIASRDVSYFSQKISFVSQENSDTIVTMTVPGNNCGVWNIVCNRSYYLDVFKIFKKKIKFNSKCQVVIMPDCDYPVEVHMEEMQKVFADTEIVEEEKGNNVSEVVDVRDYEPGDKLNLIHWKMSSKRNKLTVKEFGSDAQRRIRLYFDCNAVYSLAVRDASMSALYSVGLWLLNADLKFDIVSQDEIEQVIVDNIFNEEQLRETIIRILQRPFYHKSKAVNKQYTSDLNNALFDCFYITENGIGGV